MSFFDKIKEYKEKKDMERVMKAEHEIKQNKAHLERLNAENKIYAERNKLKAEVAKQKKATFKEKYNGFLQVGKSINEAAQKENKAHKAVKPPIYGPASLNNPFESRKETEHFSKGFRKIDFGGK